MTLKEWFKIWFSTYKTKLRQHTRNDYERFINKYLEHLLDVPIAEIKAYQLQLALNNISANRVRVITYQILNNAFKFAYGNEYVPFNPILGVQNNRGLEVSRRALTDWEFKAINAVCQSDNFKMLLLFYLETGVRRSEALTVQVKDVDFKNSRIFIRGTKTHNAKRYVPITDELKNALLYFKPMSGDLLFIFAKDYVTKHFKALCKRAGIHDICLHCLRHTFITNCKNRKVDALAVKYWVGHADILTTLNIYTHTDDGFLKQNSDLLNNKAVYKTEN